ncbi:MAG: GntR family transcriptional regulator [Mailhella sp.]|nr:GntR family transcriptional regulator [Mailhella sp.]
MKGQINPSSVVDEIVAEIEHRIVSGVYRPGQRLVEAELIAEWDISRTSLREAFRILESNGYLKHFPRRGVAVASLSHKDVMDIYQVRAVLEGLVLKLAIENASDELIKKLLELNELMLKAYAVSDLEKYRHYNILFHEEILQASQNIFLISVMHSIHKNVERCMSYLQPGIQNDSNLSHKKIIEAFQKKNAAEAEASRHDRILAMADLVISKIPETE